MMNRYPVSAVIVMTLLICAAAGCGQTVNLVPNPGLEMDTDGDNVPDAWHPPDPSQYPDNWKVGGGKAVVRRSNVAHSGDHSILYSRAPAEYPPLSPPQWWDFSAWQKQEDTAEGHWAVTFKTDDFPVEEYHLYRCRGWVKAEDILKLHIKFVGTYVYPHKEEPVERWIHPVLHSPDHSSRKTGTWGWQMWETLVPVPEFVEKGRIEFWIREWGAPAKLYADDVSVTEIRPFPYFKRRRPEL